MRLTDYRVLVVTAVVALSACFAYGIDVQFTQEFSTDWTDANNWRTMSDDPVTPTTDDQPVIGSYVYPGVTVNMAAGYSTSAPGIEIGNYGSGTLIMGTGSTLDMDGYTVYLGYAGGDYDPSITATLVSDGTISYGANGFNIAGFTKADVTLDSNALITTTAVSANFNVGMSYHMDDDKSFPYSFINNGATIHTTRAFYMQGMFEDSLFQMNGGTIDTPSTNPNTGYSFWHMGGTFEVGASSTIDNDGAGSGAAIFAEGWYKGFDVPVLKFSGTGTVLTVTGEAGFLSTVDPGDTFAAVLDVSDLIVTPGQWTTILAAGSITSGGELALSSAMADANWELRIDGSNVQVKYPSSVIPGDANLDGYVDDDDLSLLLSSWGQVADWANGEFSGIDPVNDDDLSILLTNWHVGTPPAAGELIPEPATMVLLGLGTVALIRKRR